MMDLDSAIRHCLEVADGQTEQGRCPECAEDHRQLAEWLTDYKRLKERESWEDEYIKYIKVPKKALKYRTAGMVAYNAEWLKNHFDIERTVICGAQQSYEGDAISRQAVISAIDEREDVNGNVDAEDIRTDIVLLPPVNPQRTGHWIVDVDRWGDIVTTVNGYRCSECNTFNTDKDNYCPNCGCAMVEPQEEVNNG